MYLYQKDNEWPFKHFLAKRIKEDPVSIVDWQVRDQKYLCKVKSLYKELIMRELVQEFYGEYGIPIITIHKSKGLEYHTVTFIGVEAAAFFVALSRAKQKMIFTISEKRNILKYGKEKNVMQKTENFSELIQTLMDAGMPLIEESNLDNIL